VSLIWAFIGNCGNQLVDVKGEMQERERKLKHESTEARSWGGSTRSSDEVAVMDMERRG